MPLPPPELYLKGEFRNFRDAHSKLDPHFFEIIDRGIQSADAALWVAVAEGIKDCTGAWRPLLKGLVPKEPRAICWLLAAGRLEFLFSGANHARELREFLWETPDIQRLLAELEKDPDDWVRQWVVHARHLYQGQDRFIGQNLGEGKFPDWLSSWALDRCGADIQKATMLCRTLVKQMGPIDRRPLDYWNGWVRDWLKGYEQGAKKAKSGLRSGKLEWICRGGFGGGPDICPECMVHSQARGKCPKCGGLLLKAQMPGCIITAEIQGAADGHNAILEEYIRANINPEFDWDKLKKRR